MSPIFGFCLPTRRTRLPSASARRRCRFIWPRWRLRSATSPTRWGSRLLALALPEEVFSKSGCDETVEGGFDLVVEVDTLDDRVEAEEATELGREITWWSWR